MHVFKVGLDIMFLAVSLLVRCETLSCRRKLALCLEEAVGAADELRERVQFVTSLCVFH